MNFNPRTDLRIT